MKWSWKDTLLCLAPGGMPYLAAKKAYELCTEPHHGPFELFVKDHVDEPAIGSVVCCPLAGVVEHSGIYVGNGSIIHRAGEEQGSPGRLEVVNPEKFLRRLDGNNPAITIFVACYRTYPIHDLTVAQRAVRALRDSTMNVGYDLFSNNCHQFTSYCVTGKKMKDFRFAALEELLLDCNHLENWRTWNWDSMHAISAKWHCPTYEELAGHVGLSDVSGPNRAKNSQSSAGAKSEMMTNSGCGSRNVMFVLSQSGRNQYDVMQWLISHQFSTQFVQKRSVLKTSMPYAEAMQWKRELEALGATVEVS